MSAIGVHVCEVCGRVYDTIGGYLNCLDAHRSDALGRPAVDRLGPRRLIDGYDQAVGEQHPQSSTNRRPSLLGLRSPLTDRLQRRQVGFERPETGQFVEQLVVGLSPVGHGAHRRAADAAEVEP